MQIFRKLAAAAIVIIVVISRRHLNWRRNKTPVDWLPFFPFRIWIINWQPSKLKFVLVVVVLGGLINQFFFFLFDSYLKQFNHTRPVWTPQKWLL